MAKKIKKAKDIEVETEVVKPEIRTKEFTLKADFQGRKAGEKVRLGEKGEQFYKSKNKI